MAKKETKSSSSKKTKTEAAVTKTAKKASKKETKKVATKATKKAEKPKPKKEKKVKEEKPKKVKKEKKEPKKKIAKLNSDNDDDDADNLLLINTVPSKKEKKEQEKKTNNNNNNNNNKRRLNLLTLHTPAKGEKRGATARSTSSDNFTSRIARALSQPLFLVGRLRADEKQEDNNNNDTSLFPTEVFTVLGSTGNVYTCTIGKFPECSCPDHQKGNVCKHLIFVLHRVLDVPQTSELLPQKAFLRSEVEDMLESGRRKSPKNNYLANEKVRKLLSGDEDDKDDNKNEDAAEEKEARNKGDSCAVCFEDLEKNLLICSECRNAVHKTCWNQFQTFNKTNQCILCRGKFLDEKDQASNNASSSSAGEGYQNVAGLQSGLLRHRTYNPSSYYSSRSWRRW